MSAARLAAALLAGLLVGVVVAQVTDPGVTFCVDTIDGTGCCRAQGGPNLVAALGADAAAAGLVAVLRRGDFIAVDTPHPCPLFT